VDRSAGLEDPLDAVAVQEMSRSLANLERRSQLRRLDDVLEALEVLNLRDSRVLSAGLAKKLDELGIQSATSEGQLTKLIDRVLEAQEPFMMHPPPEARGKLPRATFDPERLQL
jgi:hypothetical protein